MKHLAIVAVMSLLVAAVLMYGALRTAERIARRQFNQVQQQTESTTEQ